MDFKYGNIVNEGGKDKMVMLLFGVIGDMLNGDVFANEMKRAFDSGVRNFDLKINSNGGSTVQGNSIIAMMDYINENGGIFSGENVGNAYSKAAEILSSCAKGHRKARFYSSAMIHNPFPKSGEMNPELKKLTDETKNSIVSRLAVNTSQDPIIVSKWMDSTTFFNAEKQKEFGLVDEITGKFDQTQNAKIESILDDYDRMSACAELYNQSVKTSQKKISMNEEVYNLLGLVPEASGIAVAQAIRKVQEENNSIPEIKNELKTTKAALDLLKAENESLKQSVISDRVDAMVNEAVTKGQIQENHAQMWKDAANANFDSTKKLIEGLTPVVASVNSQLDGKGKDPVGSSSDVALAEKFAKLLDESPEKIDNLLDSEREAMEAAYEKHIASDLSISINN